MPQSIILTQGKLALVDEEDVALVSPFLWHATEMYPGKFYAARRIGARILLMHRVIMAAPSTMEVDHRDGNGLNNLRTNLRLASHQQNMGNRGPNKNNTSGYKGVSFDKVNRKWMAQIMMNRRMKKLGRFLSREDAAAAYDAAARTFFGEFARLNLPPPSLAVALPVAPVSLQRRPQRIDNTSGFRGVSYDKKRKTWVAQIGVRGALKYLGCFLTAEEAARRYDAAARQFHGETAVLNFLYSEEGRG